MPGCPTPRSNGDLVTIHNIRNFDYRTETDFMPRYYDKTFDLRQLDSVDVIASYWMGDAIAHIFLSFGFADKDFLAISIETRRRASRELLHRCRFFQAVRVVLCRRRRTGSDPAADQLPEGSAGGCLSLPDQSPSRQRAEALSRLPTRDQLASRKTRVLQRAHDQLHDQYSNPYSSQPGRPTSLVESPPQRLYSSISL